MKTIGLIGGMSWESSALYYKLINEAVRDRLGGLHSASLIMHSYDFETIKALQYAGKWGEAGDVLASTAAKLEAAGAEAILVCTNTMHKVAGQIIERTSIPLLHIADCTADRLLARGIGTTALLGTKFTMEEDFYKARLEARGLKVLIPGDSGRAEVNRVIYEELCQGKVLAHSRERYIQETEALAAAGAEAVILGCTEIGMLIKEGDVSIPTFDTTIIHAEAAADFAVDR